MSVAYAIHEDKKTARAKILPRAALRNILAKEPRDAAGLFRKLSTLASPFGVLAAARYNLAAFS
jgi:hypothetical protein